MSAQAFVGVDGSVVYAQGAPPARPVPMGQLGKPHLRLRYTPGNGFTRFPWWIEVVRLASGARTSIRITTSNYDTPRHAMIEAGHLYVKWGDPKYQIGIR